MSCLIETTLVSVPLPPEREEAYWEAIRVLAELLRCALEQK